MGAGAGETDSVLGEMEALRDGTDALPPRMLHTSTAKLSSCQLNNTQTRNTHQTRMTVAYVREVQGIRVSCMAFTRRERVESEELLQVAADAVVHVHRDAVARERLELQKKKIESQIIARAASGD